MTAAGGLDCWLYVSLGTLPADRLEAEVQDIVAISRAWNADHGLSGALMATATHFAQWLEGPPDEVAWIRARISADPRHRELIALGEGPIAARRFADWSLAYAGGNRAFDDMAASLRAMRPANARILLAEMLARFTDGQQRRQRTGEGG